ncbi:tetratricopeptide repeat protein [Bradyrhizobium sp.]|uniref:tetratricopeptide repeat protein n=1 Tax=Bradyrhizobium sp. TaxID=376 RepID=UPI001DC3B09A|nr:tetratricopeptide repeat protein [Bradyrhizobium sp.]MBV8700639.1 tetratricopeptide repeat protein [Bradyrhizobium sp.]MBV8918618.1 tetratricopeptide repeat protein [Bradyrhizobium sp.]
MIANSLAAEPSAEARERLSRCVLVGREQFAAGRTADAAATYRDGLASVADVPAGSIPVEIVSDLHANLANALLVAGDLLAAAESYKAALRLVPGLTACWCNLGNVHLRTGRAQDAIALYLEALKFDPGHWPTRTNLVQALVATRQHLVAKALLLELIAERPGEGRLHHELGKVCFELTEMDQAIRHFEAAFATNPADAESVYWIGAVAQARGDDIAAQEAYARAAQIQPLIRRPAAKSPADFRVLALYAPFAGNTPSSFLFKDTDFETDTLALLPSTMPEITFPNDDIALVVNLISDADQAADVLPRAADLAARLGKRTINEPAGIMRTTRDAVADFLLGMPGCRIPKIQRVKAGENHPVAALEAAPPFPFPLLVRPCGTHGGDDFEKIADGAALAGFLAQRPGHDHYLIEYVDYRSADGYFRKYRFIFVGEQILPYHLAIGRDWKLHHDSTDMEDHAWMQQEEAAFLQDPTTAFNIAHQAALRAIKDRIGLDFFGIDCGVDAAGDLVVFEVNASMLVHEGNEKFPYKDPFVQKIRTAFHDMLRTLADGAA